MGHTGRLKRMLSALWYVLPVIGALGCFCGPQPGPEPDTCQGPNSKGISSVTLGGARSQADNETTAFTPLEDGGKLIVFRGGQGSDMVGLRFAVDGPSECMTQKTELFDGTERILVNEVPLRTYEVQGQRVTAPLWLPGSYRIGSTVRVVTTVGAASQTVEVVAVEDEYCEPGRICTCAALMECVRLCVDRACINTCVTESDYPVRAQYEPVEQCRQRWCNVYPDGGLQDSGTAAPFGQCTGWSEARCAQCSRAVLASDPSECVSSEPNCQKCTEEQRACEAALP